MADKTGGKIQLTNTTTVNMIFTMRNAGIPGTKTEKDKREKIVLRKRDTTLVDSDAFEWLKKQKIFKHNLDKGFIIVGANFGNKEPVKRTSQPGIPADLKPPKEPQKVGPAQVVIETGKETDK